jgi:hypothetical protein
MAASSHSPRTANRRPGTAKRRLGYTVAIIVNAALLGAVNGWPGWQSVPFLGGETAEVIPLVNVSLAVGIIVNVLNLVFDQSLVRVIGDLVTSTIGTAVIIRLWEVFPFEFHVSSVDWDLVTRVVLGFALAGCVISIIVQLVLLGRYAAGKKPS